MLMLTLSVGWLDGWVLKLLVGPLASLIESGRENERRRGCAMDTRDETKDEREAEYSRVPELRVPRSEAIFGGDKLG